MNVAKNTKSKDFWEAQLSIHAKVMSHRNTSDEKLLEDKKTIDIAVKRRYTGFEKEELIALIIKNTNHLNIEINDIVIKYLKGNTTPLYNWYFIRKGIFISLLKQKDYPYDKMGMNTEDMLMEFFIYLCEKISFGKYIGSGSFLSWLMYKMKAWIMMYLRHNGYTDEYSSKVIGFNKKRRDRYS